jgi:hypothetical protein
MARHLDEPKKSYFVPVIREQMSILIMREWDPVGEILCITNLKGTAHMVSQSLVIGHSYLPVAPLGVDSLIDAAASAAERNPEVATEIILATTDAVLLHWGAQSILCTTMKQMVERLCQARDHSLTR